jgi:hypothetical protein
LKLTTLILYFSVKLAVVLVTVVLGTTLCDRVCQTLATGWWFFPLPLFPPPIKLTPTIYLKYC